MFLFGETQERVRNGKLILPKQFHLKKKQLLSAWKDENTLCLSDTTGVLYYMAGKNAQIQTISIDADDRIVNLDKFEQRIAQIYGRISFVEIHFSK